MAIASELQQDSTGQKFAGPVDPADGTGKALRGANIDQTEGYADGQMALMDHNNANLDKADDAAITPGTVRGIPIILLCDDTSPDSVDEGDGGVPRMTAARIIRVALSDDNGLSIHKADDAAFTPGTSVVVPIAALADETGADSVDEGDAGALRMTLARILRVALSDDNGLSIAKADDAAFTPGTSVVVPIGALADETAPDSVDEGDAGALRMTLNRLLRVIDTNSSGKNRAYYPKAELLAETAITNATSATNTTAVTGFGGYKVLVITLTVSAKSVSAGTLNIYIQTSPDDGTTWDDIISFTQITTGAVGNGTYVARVANEVDAGEADRATASGSLTANSIKNYFCDQVRVRYVPASFDGDDTVTIKVEAVAIG